MSRSQGGEDHVFGERRKSTQMFRYYKTGNDKSAEESILEVCCRGVIYVTAYGGRLTAPLFHPRWQLYETTVHLQQFAELNRTGFRKILKKYDKNMGADLLPRTMEKIDKELHFGTVRRVY